MTDRTRLEAELKPFLEGHPGTSIQEDKPGELRLVGAWGTKAVGLAFPKDASELVQALNAVSLPQALTALRHLDTKDVEFIWGPILKTSEFTSRTFKFEFNGVTLDCGYGHPSKRLLEIARNFRRQSEDVDDRNLSTLRMFLLDSSDPKRSKMTERHTPMSFWIRQFAGDDDALAEVCRHLNFYMTYFDRSSPIVLVDEQVDAGQYSEPDRFRTGSFPASVRGRPLNAYLLSMWNRASTGNAFERFLHGYQILEFAAFYLTEDDVLRLIRKTLRRPDAGSRSEALARELCDVFANQKKDEDSRSAEVIRRAVRSQDLWAVLQKNAAFFSNSTNFEGGFSLRPHFSVKAGPEEFEKNYGNHVAASLRVLRNGLAHAREMRQARGIPPSKSNRALLRPWADLMFWIASEILLYEESGVE